VHTFLCGDLLELWLLNFSELADRRGIVNVNTLQVVSDKESSISHHCLLGVFSQSRTRHQSFLSQIPKCRIVQREKDTYEQSMLDKLKYRNPTARATPIVANPDMTRNTAKLIYTRCLMCLIPSNGGPSPVTDSVCIVNNSALRPRNHRLNKTQSSFSECPGRPSRPTWCIASQRQTTDFTPGYFNERDCRE
jgi:hypothetical protein